MRISVEVRWFGAGGIPPDIDAWFRDPGSSFSWCAGGGRTRTDSYLSLGSPELGIKRRGGGLGCEVKGLVGVVRRGCRFGHAEVFPQIFSKWSADALDPSDMPSVRVEKTRWLRLFAMVPEPREIRLGAGALREDPIEAGRRPEIGCGVEITGIEVNGEEWWTFAAEAFARPGEGLAIDLVAESLTAVLRRLSEHATVDLRSATYQGYAEWLVALGSQE